MLSSLLYRVLNLFFITYIYVMFVMDSSSLNKFLIVINVILTIAIIISRMRINFHVGMFLLILFTLFSLLAFVGASLGNQAGSILKFMYPVFYLVNIYTLIELTDRFGFRRYVYHIYFASILVIFKIVFLSILYVTGLFYDYLPHYNYGLVQSTWIALNGGVLRVFVGQATIIPIGILFSYYLYGRVPYFLLLFSLVALLITQTTVLWFIWAICAAYLLAIGSKGVVRILIFLSGGMCVFIFVYFFYNEISSILNDKMLYSIPVKFAQFSIALSALRENIFFGGGLGYMYSNGSNVIEVVFLHILASTGIIGFIAYSYLFFYWCVLSVRFIKTDNLLKTLVLSYFTIVVASFSNPYLLGASSGLFLVPFIAARVIYNSNYSKNSVLNSV